MSVIKIALIVALVAIAANARIITIKNEAERDLLIGHQDAGGLPVEDIILQPLGETELSVADDWIGVIWCKGAACSDIPCGGNITLVEFALNAAMGLDFYDISLVDGFNRNATVVPEKESCATVSCKADILAECPPENQIFNDGRLVACMPTPAMFKSKCPNVYTTPLDEGAEFSCNANCKGYTITFD